MKATFLFHVIFFKVVIFLFYFIYYIILGIIFHNVDQASLRPNTGTEVIAQAVHMSASMCARSVCWRSENNCGSLIVACGFQGLGSGHQAWKQGALAFWAVALVRNCLSTWLSHCPACEVKGWASLLLTWCVVLGQFPSPLSPCVSDCLNNNDKTIHPNLDHPSARIAEQENQESEPDCCFVRHYQNKQKPLLGGWECGGEWGKADKGLKTMGGWQCGPHSWWGGVQESRELAEQ